MEHKELGMEFLSRVKADLPENAVVEQEPKLEGRQITMLVSVEKK